MLCLVSSVMVCVHPATALAKTVALLVQIISIYCITVVWSAVLWAFIQMFCKIQQDVCNVVILYAPSVLVSYCYINKYSYLFL